MMWAVTKQVENLTYETWQPSRDAMAQHSLRIDLADGQHTRVANGGWDDDNPALALMAFLGVSPSTLDEAKGTVVPIQVTMGGEIIVHQKAIEVGFGMLDEAEWFEPAEGEDVSVQQPQLPQDSSGPAPN